MPTHTITQDEGVAHPSAGFIAAVVPFSTSIAMAACSLERILTGRPEMRPKRFAGLF
jgi:hypothetical protein